MQGWLAETRPPSARVEGSKKDTAAALSLALVCEVATQPCSTDQPREAPLSSSLAQIAAVALGPAPCRRILRCRELENVPVVPLEPKATEIIP